jgi:hypothetical protein
MDPYWFYVNGLIAEVTAAMSGTTSESRSGAARPDYLGLSQEARQFGHSLRSAPENRPPFAESPMQLLNAIMPDLSAAVGEVERVLAVAALSAR